MITVHFEGDKGPKFFEIMYEGFMIGGSVERNKGMLVLRKELHILDKFEAISEPYECGKMLPINDEPCRKLIDDKQEITFDKGEADLVLRYMALVPWTTGKSVRNAIEVIDWFESLVMSSGK